MRNLFYIIILSYCIATMFCCHNSSQDTSGAVEAENPISEKKTQALILTQDFDYNPDDRNKIAGEYISHKKITVPQNLGTQNKWFMFEGPVLENDLVAYRFYGDSRHRTDIYGKISSDLVMDTVSWDYHDIMNWGSDILKVGNSLGIGSPAIWYQDSLYTLSNCQEKTIEIVESRNDKSTVRTTFKKLSVAGEVFDLVQDWSIEAGQPWSEIHLKVTKGSLPDRMYYATGIVKHLPDIMEGELGDYFYAMNWGQQSFHDENMGMAITVDKKYKPELIKDDLSHAYKFTNANQEVRYRFLSAWERDNNKIKDAIAFKKIVEQAAQ